MQSKRKPNCELLCLLIKYWKGNHDFILVLALFILEYCLEMKLAGRVDKV